MKKSLLLFASVLLISSLSFSQEYLLMIDNGTHSVQEIIDSAEEYFEDRDTGRGSGYKQFKRWEYMAKRLQNDQGYLPSITSELDELARYNAYLNETAGNRAPLNDNWLELGPTSWDATTSWNPGVGRITGLSVESTNEQHILVGSRKGGAWRTIDGGANWIPLSDEFSNMDMYSTLIDPTDSETYYLGSVSGLIYKSEDSGATWTEFADISDSLINKILINPNNTDIMFASSQNAGVYRTDDGGANWSQVFGNNAYDIEFKPGDTNTVYATGLVFQKSIDGGATFTQVNGLGGGPKMMGVSADDPSVIYVLEANGGQFSALYKSIDSGSTFIELDHSGRNYFGYDTNGFANGGQAPRDMDITVNPNDADEVHIAGILTWRSMNGGVDFENTADWIPGSAAAAGVGYHHADVDILEFVNNTLYVGSDGGIFKAEDTANLSANYYEDITAGLGIREFYKFGVSQTEDVVITGGAQDNGSSFYTEAGGWKDWIGADGMEGFVDKDDSNIMYGTSQNGILYRTDNGGNGFGNINEPLPGDNPGNWVTPWEQDPNVSNVIYSGYDAIYKSTNKGASWDRISQTFPSNFDELKIAPTNTNFMYASRGGLFYRTFNGGATDWQQGVSPGGFVNAIAVHPLNPGKVAVAVIGSNKVKITEDGGTTWETLNEGLPNFTALSITWDKNGEDGLYVGMNYGIYYIDNTLTEWQPYSNNLPNVRVNELEINYVNETLYAATDGRGVWASPTKNGTILSNESFLTSSEVVLYPNPASSEVTLRIADNVEGDIRVFDMAGKLLQYHANVTIENDFTLDVSELSTGIYFIRLNSNLGTVTKRFSKQ